MKPAKWVIAVDIGATHITGALVSNHAEIRSLSEMATIEDDDKPSLRERIFSFVEKLAARAEKAEIKVLSGDEEKGS